MARKRDEFTLAEFLGLTWGLFAIAFTFLFARLLIRLKLYGHLMIDDGLVILSFVALLAICIIETAIKDTIFQVQHVETDHQKPPPDFEKITTKFAHYQWAIAYLYFTGIWAIKGSFLYFYDRLTQRLTWFRRVWWAAIVITILTYIGSLFAYGFLNGNQFKKSLKNEAIRYQFSVDFSTDVIITAIPLTLAFKSNIALKQKLALAGVFSMSLIVTIIAIVRFALNSPSRPPVGPSWIQVWSTIEHSVSIAIASAASFRTFVLRKNATSDQISPDQAGGSSNIHRNARKGRISDKLGFSGLHTSSILSRPKPQESNSSMDLELLNPNVGDVPSHSPTPRALENSRTHAGMDRHYFDFGSPHNTPR